MYNKYLFNIYGGRFLGQGTYKCVYSPPLLCNVPIESQPFDLNQAIEYAGALMEEDNAAEEMAELEKIKKIDQIGEFTVQPAYTCDVDLENIQNYPMDLENKKLRGFNPFTSEDQQKCHLLNKDDPDEEPDDLNKQLIYYMGGYNLETMRITAGRGGPDIITFLRAFHNVIYGVKKINESGYLHNDIKALNILYNHDTNKFKIIDFGLLIEIKNIYDSNPPHNILYEPWSPDINLTTDIADYIKNFEKSPDTEFVQDAIVQYGIDNLEFKDENFYFTKKNGEIVKEHLQEFLNQSALKLDVYSLGLVMYNLFKKEDLVIPLSNVHFYLKDFTIPGLIELTIDMMNPIPFLRPSIQEVEIRFIDIINSMSGQKFNLSTIRLIGTSKDKAIELSDDSDSD